MIPVITEEPPEVVARCSRCRKWKPGDQFYRAGYTYCRPCAAEVNRESYERRKTGVRGKRGKKSPRRCDWCGVRPIAGVELVTLHGSPVCPDCVPKAQAGERPEDREAV